MSWLLKSLLGPGIWAATFSAAYALHGVGCAYGWSAVSIPPGSLHQAAMLAVWLAGLLACLALLRALPAGGGLQHRLPRAGAWIGLAATGFTLFPLFIATTC